MKFGDNLKTLRKKNNISQEVLADKVGVSRQSVSKWETGDAYPEMNNILQLCKIFHCNIGELVNDNIVDIDSLDEDVKMKVVKLKEEKQKKVKVLSKIIYIVSKIGKIFCTIGLVMMTALFLIAPFFIKDVKVVNDRIVINDNNNTIEIVEKGNNLSLRYNKKIVIADIDSKTEIKKITNIVKNNSTWKLVIGVELALISVILVLGFVSYMLSHLEKFFKNIHDGDTPFTLDNVKHIKKIAYAMILSILIPPVFGLVSSLLIEEISFDLPAFSIIEILVIFTMAYIFEYGYEVQLYSIGKMYGEYKDE